ncbi:MAG TPA: DNA alkylation repair protein [Actinomycetota bacterium]|nr:DNA alkylation repair protein [Actinomycetota bacterium]
MNARAALAELRRRADPSRKPGMARVGIDVERALGVSMPDIRAVAKACGTDHRVALELWGSGIHEARILATLVADPLAFTQDEIEAWVVDIASWDVCDSAADAFGRSPEHARLIRAWARRPEGYVRRCAFSTIARRAVWAKGAPDREFLAYLPLIRGAATDDRNEVRKGVSWALRQIGKRNVALHGAALAEARTLLELEERSARWIARDAIRELERAETRARLPDPAR